MFVDSQCLLGEDMDLSAGSASIIYGAYAYNLGSTKDPGGGRPIYMVIVIDEAMTSANSTGTVVFALVDEEDETIDSGSVEIVQTDPLLVTRLTLGKVIVIPIPAGIITQQYLGVRATIGGETTTAGTATVFLALDPLSNMGA